MEILEVVLKNKRKDKKYIKFTIRGYWEGSELTHDVTVSMFHNVVCIPESNSEDNQYKLIEESLKYFYWLNTDDRDLENPEFTYEDWKKWITGYYRKCYGFRDAHLENIAIESFRAYKQALK